MASKELTCHLTIGQHVFRYATDVKIMSSWKTIGDTAKITLPNLKGLLEKEIQAGEPVEIKLGYDGNLRKEFTGFVKSTSPDIPFVVECEDGVYHLKRRTIKKSWASTSLKDVLAYVAPGIKVSDAVPDMPLSPFRISEATAFEILEKLCKDYLLAVYFRNGELFAGLAYTEFTSFNSADGSLAKFNFQKNVAQTALTFRGLEDVKLKAKAVSYLPGNKKVTVEVGDPDGETRTLLFRGVSEESALRRVATEELSRLKYEGYYGEFTGFGVPYVVHSGAVDLEDADYPSRRGRYAVDQVEVSWGVQSGFRRKIKLGPKLSLS